MGTHLTEALTLDDLRRHVGVGALQRLDHIHVLDAAHAKVAYLGREPMRPSRVIPQQDVACAAETKGISLR